MCMLGFTSYGTHLKHLIYDILNDVRDDNIFNFSFMNTNCLFLAMFLFFLTLFFCSIVRYNNPVMTLIILLLHN